MPKNPREPKKDPLADEIDALLGKLPGADPFLKGDPEDPSPGDSTGANLPANTTGTAVQKGSEPTRRDRLFVWLRVCLGILLGVGVTQWPYLRTCGLPLLGFLATLLVVAGVGVWASVWAWRTRMAIPHLLALGVLGWGAAMMANQILLRTDYAAAKTAWRCPAPAPAPAVPEGGGFVRRPDGTVLRYQEIGSGPPHVLAAGAWVLSDLLRPLAAQQGVVLYDPRRRGASVAANDTLGFGIDVDVDDMAAVRQHFAAEGIAVVGWSYSTATAARFAALRSDIVSRLILIAAIPPRRSSYQLDYTRGLGQDTLGLELLRIMRIRGEDMTNRQDYCRRYWEIAVLRPWLSDSCSMPLSSLNPCKYQNEQPIRREASITRLLEAYGDWDWTQNAAGYAGPVLVIHGASDPFPIEGAQEWVESLPNARMLSVPGAGHMPWLEQPDLVRSAIETFLEGRWPAAAVGNLPDSTQQ